MEIDTAAHVFGRRIWIRRLKNGLAVEHPIASDELRAIKRYLAIRRNALPWLFVSKREQPLARPSVTYLIAMAARRGRTAARPFAHAATFMRLLSRQSRLRPAAHPGLPRAPRSEAHCPLHAGRREPFRRPLEMTPADFRTQRPIWRLVTRLFGLGHVGWICAKLAFPVGGCRGCLR